MFESRVVQGWLAACLVVLGSSCSSQEGGTPAAGSAGAAADAVDPELSKLPIPAGAKTLYAGPASVIYTAGSPVEATTAECKRLLAAQGWQPYGSAGETWFFKRNLQRLTAQISSAPAQQGQTMIQYTLSTMSVDLPAPAEVIRLHYVDSSKRLDFDTADAAEKIFEFYQTELAKRGWKPTTEQPLADGPKQFTVYRNEAKDMLTLEVRDIDGNRRAQLEHRSAAEVEEMDRKFKAEQERLRAASNTPLPKLAVVLPTDDALRPKDADVKIEKAQVNIKLESGKARAFVEFWRKHFVDSGWKEEVATLDASAGSLAFTKSGQQITISYVDPGLIPAEITLLAVGVELESGAAK